MIKIIAQNVGYVKRYRKIQEHWLYEFTPKNPRDRVGAWDDLIAMAIFSENGEDKFINGQKIHCDRGQLFISRRSLAALWGWGIGKVDRFTRDLQADRMIDIERFKSGSRITIMAYDLYQSNEPHTIQQMKQKREESRTLNNKKQKLPTVEEEKNNSAPAEPPPEEDNGPSPGSPEWWELHRNDDFDDDD